MLVLLHLAALAILLRTEDDLVPAAGLRARPGGCSILSGCSLLRRPAVAASLSLVMIVVLILLSQFKQDILIMSANFVDVMLIDADTVSFLLTIFPELRCEGRARSPASALPLLALFWWLDPFRVRLRIAALGAVVCLAALSALSLAVPMDREKAFESADYVSQFARSGALALFDLTTRGLLESDSVVRDRLSAAAPAACKPGQRLPHIVLVLDESSFDISAVPGVKVPPGYQSHFRSFDGKERTFLVEGAGGPTWYTEYNVLSGLVGALLRPFRRVRDADRRRPRHARACRTRCTTAAIAPTASIPGSALFSARAISRRRSASITSTTPRISRRATSSRTNSTTPSPPIC